VLANSANYQAGGEGGDLRYRVLAVDKLVELDTLVSDYDSEYFRPAGANVRSFLVECLGKLLIAMNNLFFLLFSCFFEKSAFMRFKIQS
jgi:hypothetical protein